jgi:hypothetical protein
VVEAIDGCIRRLFEPDNVDGRLAVPLDSASQRWRARVQQGAD